MFSFTKTKAYGFKNYQDIVDLTHKKIKWFQVGLENDFILNKIHLDLRGNNLEFLVDIISFADLILADEGLLNHIAGSFPKVNSYVVFSEFSPEVYYSYANTITIGKPKDFHKTNYWSKESSKKNKKESPVKLAKIILDNEF